MSGLTVKVKKQKDLKREVKVSVPSSVVEAKKMQRFEQIAKTAKLPGFRPGKAPINIIQSQYGNQVNQEVLSDVLESSYIEAITEEELDHFDVLVLCIERIEVHEHIEHCVVWALLPCRQAEVVLADAIFKRVPLCSLCSACLRRKACSGRNCLRR